MLQLHLHSRLNIWLQGIRQRQPQDGTIIFQVLGFGAAYIRDLTVRRYLTVDKDRCPQWKQVDPRKGDFAYKFLANMAANVPDGVCVGVQQNTVVDGVEKITVVKHWVPAD